MLCYSPNRSEASLSHCSQIQQIYVFTRTIHTRAITMLPLWTFSAMFVAVVAPVCMLLLQALWAWLGAIVFPLSRWRSYLPRQRSTTEQACASEPSGDHQLPPATPAQVAALIQSRRSIFPKSMTGAPVSRDSILAMLQAANWAPTHGRTEPWRFVVLGRAGMEAMQLLTEDIFRSQLAGHPEMLHVRSCCCADFTPTR
jgi:hypothetical protein